MIAILIIILAAGLLMMAFIADRSKPRARRHAGSIDKAFVAQKWQTILAMKLSGGAGLKTAVSEADKLLDYCLKQSGVPGQTMGDRLKASGKRFSDLDGVWRAHKLRNSLAHDIQFDLVVTQANEAIDGFERGLRDLGAL